MCRNSTTQEAARCPHTHLPAVTCWRYIQHQLLAWTRLLLLLLPLSIPVVIVLLVLLLLPSHDMTVLHCSPTNIPRWAFCRPTTHSANVRLASVFALCWCIINQALDAAVQADRLDSKRCGEDDRNQEATQDV